MELKNMELKNKKRPSTALIKLVEAVGILLGIPKSSSTKSIYKAPIPTNYDATVEILCNNFYQSMNRIISLSDGDISNDVAADLYEKSLEPGFDYEDALKDGGLTSRELFNLVYFILLKLQSDPYRLPVAKTNYSIVVDGSRSSYSALDVGTHMFNHGMCHVIALSVGESESSAMREHLFSDISRRCKLQYKLVDHCFNVSTLCASNAIEVPNRLAEVLRDTCTDMLVIGLSDNNIGAAGNSKMSQWACWDSALPVVLSKGCSRMRPFHSVSMSRLFQICVKRLEDIRPVFMKSLLFLKPGDRIIVVVIVKSKDGLADSRSSRYENGSRSGWVQGSAPLCPDFAPEYTAEFIETVQSELTLLINKAQVVGKSIVQFVESNQTIAQKLCAIAHSERSDVLVLKYKGVNKEVIVDCVMESCCSVAILK